MHPVKFNYIDLEYTELIEAAISATKFQIYNGTWPDVVGVPLKSTVAKQLQLCRIVDHPSDLESSSDIGVQGISNF